MKKLSPTGGRLLKTVHIALACAWLGGTVSILLVQILAKPGSGGGLHGVHLSMKILDDFVIIPAAFGSLGTGFLYGWLTRWGFFRQRWITIKWIATIGMIVFGAACLGPWINRTELMTRTTTQAVLTDTTFRRDVLLSQIFGALQVLLLTFLVWLSVFKPWRRKPPDKASKLNMRHGVHDSRRGSTT